MIPDYNDTYYNDSKYRLELTFNGIIAAAAPPDLFVKQGLFEKKYKLPGEYLRMDLVDSIKIKDLSKFIEITFYHRDTICNPTNPLKVIVNKKK
jgi:hypothetical protein